MDSSDRSLLLGGLSSSAMKSQINEHSPIDELSAGMSVRTLKLSSKYPTYEIEDGELVTDSDYDDYVSTPNSPTRSSLSEKVSGEKVLSQSSLEQANIGAVINEQKIEEQQLIKTCQICKIDCDNCICLSSSLLSSPINVECSDTLDTKTFNRYRVTMAAGFYAGMKMFEFMNNIGEIKYRDDEILQMCIDFSIYDKLNFSFMESATTFLDDWTDVDSSNRKMGIMIGFYVSAICLPTNDVNKYVDTQLLNEQIARICKNWSIYGQIKKDVINVVDSRQKVTVTMQYKYYSVFCKLVDSPCEYCQNTTYCGCFPIIGDHSPVPCTVCGKLENNELKDQNVLSVGFNLCESCTIGMKNTKKIEEEEKIFSRTYSSDRIDSDVAKWWIIYCKYSKSDVYDSTVSNEMRNRTLKRIQKEMQLKKYRTRIMYELSEQYENEIAIKTQSQNAREKRYDDIPVKSYTVLEEMKKENKFLTKWLIKYHDYAKQLEEESEPFDSALKRYVRSYYDNLMPRKYIY